MSTPTQEAFDELYWSVQQTAVQKARGLSYYAALSLAGQLAQEGYVFDAAVVAWGYDPFLITQERLGYGYTWIPSAGMPPITIAPGLSQPGVPSYDPAIIPPGGIPVTYNVTAAMFPGPTATAAPTESNLVRTTV